MVKVRKLMSMMLATSMLTVTLTGCNNSSSNTNVADVAPLTFEEVASDKANMQLSAEEKESVIYRYMSDDISIDTEKLLPIEGNSEEHDSIISFISDVNSFLTTGKSENNEISDELINYMLMEFAKTPYEWTQSPSGIKIIGMDPATRLMFVDVEYVTSNTKKTVLPDSTIPKGHTMEEALLQMRYEEYTAYLDAKYGNSSGKGASVEELYDMFVKHWGNPEDIIETQAVYTLTERIAKFGNETKGIGKYTYSGIVNDEQYAQTGATMSFRFILNNKFNLGQKRGLEVKALYLKDYKADNCDTVTALPTVSDTTGLEVLEPYITRLINSYRKAVEETNHIGLYQLFTDYKTLDKYYVDYGEYTYNKGEGFTFDIIDRTEDTLTIRIYRTQKVRAKGSYMSYPKYAEILVGKVQLCDDDKLRFISLTQLSSKLEGEPLSIIKNVEGISEQMLFSSVEFTEENEKAVEKLIEDFSVYQMNQTISADTFTKIIDTGISATTVDSIKKTVAAIQANEKITWISSYATKSNSYAEVKLREVYLCDTSNYDTESTLSMINRDGTWKVIGYVRTLNVPTSKTEVNDTYSLCRTVKGAVESIITENGEVIENVPNEDTTSDTNINDSNVESDVSSTVSDVNSEVSDANSEVDSSIVEEVSNNSEDSNVSENVESSVDSVTSAAEDTSSEPNNTSNTESESEVDTSSSNVESNISSEAE